MNRAEHLYQRLVDDFGFKGSEGKVTFTLRDTSILVRQNNIVGNILEEWLAKWMDESGIPHIYNHKQSSPDFWLDPDHLEDDWLEMKSFTGSPNFDVAAFRSFVSIILAKPYKLQSDYLLVEYSMRDGVVTIDDCWLRKIWQICGTSERWPLKVQYKNKQITNIRPATWYSSRVGHPVFDCLEDFLSALEETIFRYHETHMLTEGWRKRLADSYESHYGVRLRIPRWEDIRDKYVRE